MNTQDQLDAVSIHSTWIVSSDQPSWYALNTYRDKWLRPGEADDDVQASMLYPYVAELDGGPEDVWILEIHVYALGDLNQDMIECVMQVHRGNIDMLLSKYGGTLLRYEQQVTKP